MKKHEQRRLTLRVLGSKVFIALPYLDNCDSFEFERDVTKVFERSALLLGWERPKDDRPQKQQRLGILRR